MQGKEDGKIFNDVWNVFNGSAPRANYHVFPHSGSVLQRELFPLGQDIAVLLMDSPFLRLSFSQGRGEFGASYL